MNINSIILFFVLFQFNLVFANNFQDKSETSALPDQVVDLTIFHTNDIHSHMHAPKSDEFHLGGLARLSTLLKSLREQSPLAITLDAGDWSEGTWYYNIDAGQNMLRILNQIGYDTVVVGNHDYLSGPDLLLGTVKNARVNFKVLAANLDFANYTNAGEFQQSILPYVILEKQGIKIGVIGLTQNGYEYAGYFKPVVVTSPLKEAIKQARALRSKVDVLILLSHNHFILNEQIARLTPGIDAVISGHTHKKISKAVMVWNISGKKVPVVETEAWGKFIGELHFKVDLQNKKVAYESYQLHPVVPTLKEDPVISQMIAEEDQKLKQLAGMDTSQIIGWSEIPLGSHDSREAGLCDLLVKSLQKTTQSEAAIELVSLTGVDLPAGPITVMDAHNVMPHLYNFETKKEWTIKLWKASGRDLGLITKIAYLPNILPLKETGFFCFDKLEVTWAPKISTFSIPKILNIDIGQQKLDLNKKYLVAVTDGMLLGIKTFNDKFHLGFDLSEIQETGIEVWRAILDYIRDTQKITHQNLSSGGRSFTSVADPAIFTYSISNKRDMGLEVSVFNAGIQPVTSGKLVCYAGAVNDPVLFRSNGETKTIIGEQPLPKIEPFEEVVVSIPWQITQAGTWPVFCNIDSKEDGYLGNSSARKVLELFSN